MTNKAYIVANEEQEREVLEKLEREGYVWRGLNIKPTKQPRIIDEPIPIFARDDKRLTFDYKVNEAYLADYEIVFDGRKEERMSKKYVVSQEFMNELEDWKLNTVDGVFINDDDIEDLPYIIVSWWVEEPSDEEGNNRLIAIIRWVNGEDVFEVEKPKKWVVRSKEHDGQYFYGKLLLANNNTVFMGYSFVNATRFDTKEEAESWANAHQEVVQVEVEE